MLEIKLTTKQNVLLHKLLKVSNSFIFSLSTVQVSTIDTSFLNVIYFSYPQLHFRYRQINRPVI